MSKYLYLLFFLFTCTTTCFSQDAEEIFYPDSLPDFNGQRVVIDEVMIRGNKRTKRNIITREMQFNPGDTLLVKNLKEQLSLLRERIFNTNLFVTVDVGLTPGKNPPQNGVVHSSLVIVVAEEWYIIPNPIFELSDRNFNEWVNDYDADLTRVNYGIRYSQFNVRGRAEKLRLVIQGGFTDKYELFYSFPYVGKAQRFGTGFGISYSTNKDVAFATRDNKLVWVRDTAANFTRSRFRTGMDFRIRNEFYATHNFSLNYHWNQATQKVVDSNNFYFLNGEIVQRFFQLSYNFGMDQRDIQAYAYEGFRYSINFNKTGLWVFDDIDNYQASIDWSQYIPLGKNFYYSYLMGASVSFPDIQPYNQYGGLGFGQNFIRGYERYVINAQHYYIMKNTLRFLMFSRDYYLAYSPIQTYKNLSIDILPNLYFDFGYAHDNLLTVEWNNRLANRLNYGYGAGLDIVTYKSNVIRIEYSINHLNEGTFKLHFASAI